MLNITTRQYQAYGMGLLSILLIIYILGNYLPLNIRTCMFFTYVCQPIMWVLAIFTAFSFQKTKPQGKIRLKVLLRWMAGIFAVAYIFLMMLIGLAEGFGKSPFNHSIFGIITNVIFISTLLVGRELIRDYLVNSIKIKSFFITLGIISLLMTITSISVDTIDQLKTKLDVVKFLGENVLPEFSNNFLACYLVYLGGPILSIIYLGTVQIFYWLSPILPNMSWISKAFVGTLCPLFCLMLLQNMCNNELKVIKKHQTDENLAGWICTSIAFILIIWFCIGVFPIRPFAIATGSMEPVIYAGDVVLSKRIEPSKLKIGDIIQYKKDNIYIFHRITGIINDPKGVKFNTKGDNNPIPDPQLVKSEDIKGIVVYKVPKVGWPSLLLKSSKTKSSEPVKVIN